MQDSEIIALYWQRDEAAIAETSRKYGAYCFRIAANILTAKEDAEECVNDAYRRSGPSILARGSGGLCATWHLAVGSMRMPGSATGA